MGPSGPAPSAAANLNAISDVKLSAGLVDNLKAKIAASPNANNQGNRPPNANAFDLNDLYNILVRFAANRETYTGALAHYTAVFRDHPGMTGVLYRDQAYAQLVQSADDLLVSLKTLKDYVLDSGIATNGDTVQIATALQAFTYAKGGELHSVVDSLHVTGLSADELQAVSAQAAVNGATLQSQIQTLQQMLITKGASLRVSNMPQSNKLN